MGVMTPQVENLENGCSGIFLRKVAELFPFGSAFLHHFRGYFGRKAEPGTSFMSHRISMASLLPDGLVLQAGFWFSTVGYKRTFPFDKLALFWMKTL